MLQPLLGDGFVPFGALLIPQGRFHIAHMRLDSRTRRHGVPGLQRLVDDPMLLKQGLAGCALPEHDLTVVEHALAQKLEHGAHHVQHHDVVARLDDCHVEAGIQLRLFLGGAARVKLFHLPEDRIDDLQVGIRGKARGPLCRQPFHIPPEGDVVEHGLFMGCKQLYQRIRKGRAKHIGNKDARPGPACEQAALLQFLERAPLWADERRIELATLAEPLTGATGVEGLRRLCGMALWLQDPEDKSGSPPPLKGAAMFRS